MELYYKNNRNEIVNLSKWPIMLQNPETLLEYKWEYGTKNNRISYFKKAIMEMSLDISIFADSEEEFNDTVDHLFEKTEIDVLQEEPGEIHIGEQYMKCYVLENEMGDYDPDCSATDITLKIVTDNAWWYSEKKFEFRPTKATDVWLDYPHEIPYDYLSNLVSENINNEAFSACDFRIIVYGPCVDPTIYIANHKYNVNTTLADGDYIVIDSAMRTIRKVENNGEETNIYDDRNRDSYIFERIPARIVPVSADGSFGFDLYILEERSKPRHGSKLL